MTVIAFILLWILSLTMLTILLRVLFPTWAGEIFEPYLDKQVASTLTPHAIGVIRSSFST